MTKYLRNKLIGVRPKDDETFQVHGILDDDIYSLELDLTYRISDLVILDIQGRWNRWTTPECPRALLFLDEVAGLSILAPDFHQKVQKGLSRKSCRHFANLLMDCSHAVREAALVRQWERASKGDPELTLEAFIKGARPKTAPPVRPSPAVTVKESPPKAQPATEKPIRKPIQGGMVIDLHLHTAPASPCSNAPIEEIIEEARRIGLDGICLTDHNYYWDRETVEDLKQKHGFLILRGNELITDQGDMVVFGLERDIKDLVRLPQLREEVDRSGGYVIAAHPFRGFLVFGAGQVGLTLEKAMERPLFKYVDAVEVLNGKVTRDENNFAADVAAGLGATATGGSDAHEVHEVGCYATHFQDIITNEKELIEALKAGRCAPVEFR